MKYTDAAPDGTVPRRIHDPLDVGCANKGEDVRLNLRMDDGLAEWFDIDHKLVARLVSGILFAAGVAKREREAQMPTGVAAMHANELITPSRMGLAPGPDGSAVLQVWLSPDVSLDVRLPMEALDGLADAAKKLRETPNPSGTSSAKH